MNRGLKSPAVQISRAKDVFVDSKAPAEELPVFIVRSRTPFSVEAAFAIVLHELRFLGVGKSAPRSGQGFSAWMTSGSRAPKEKRKCLDTMITPRL